MTPEEREAAQLVLIEKWLRKKGVLPRIGRNQKPMEPETKEWVYIQRAAAMKEVSRRTIYYWIAAGLLPTLEGRCKSTMVFVPALLAIEKHHHGRVSTAGASSITATTSGGSAAPVASGPSSSSTPKGR